MRKKRFLFLIGFSVLGGVMMGRVIDACDHLAATSGVGACKSGLTMCQGFTSETGCNNVTSVHDVYEIKQDFPVGTVTLNNSKVDMPSSICFRRVDACNWTGTACIDSPANSKPWSSEPKRESKACPGANDPGGGA